MSAAFSATGVATARQLFAGSYVVGGREDDPRDYDIARDGSFLVAMRVRPRDPAQHRLFVITNWTQGLVKGK